MKTKQTLIRILSVAAVAALALVPVRVARGEGVVPGLAAQASPADSQCLSIYYSQVTNTCDRWISIAIPVEHQNDWWKRGGVMATGGGSGQSVNCAQYSMNPYNNGWYSGGYRSTAVPFQTQYLELGDISTVTGGTYFVHCLMDPGTSVIQVSMWHP